MSELDLTLDHLKLLRLLRRQPQGRHYALDLARQVGVSKGSIYRVLKQLETAGYVGGRSEAGDPSQLGRPLRRLVHLTPVGLTRYTAALLDAGFREAP